MLRIGDRLLGSLTLIAAAALLVFLGWQWHALHRLSDAARPGARGAPSGASTGSAHPGFAVTAITGPRLLLSALGEHELTLEAVSAELQMPELGPFQLNLAPSGLTLSRAQARLSEPALRIRAERCRLTSDRLTFTGAVRLDDAGGKGLLFSDRLELSLESDHLQTGDLVILSPEGQSGGQGGRVVPGFDATLHALLSRSR